MAQQLDLFGQLSPVPLTPQNQVFVELISESWFRKIGHVFRTPTFQQLSIRVANAREKGTVYPEMEEVFRAYLETPFEKVKVVIMGQDVYPDDNADGLAFSCKKRMSVTLSVIHQELVNEYEFGTFRNLPNNPTLDYWAKQGVLLINSALTVNAGQSNSHASYGWECIVVPTLEELIKDQSPRVFMLWGSNAKKLFWGIDVNPECLKVHSVLEAAHPVIESRKLNQPGLSNFHFYGLNIFRKCNEFLLANGKEPIEW